MPENESPSPSPALDFTSVLAEFPDFDPLTAMADPTFARLTSPEVGLTPTEAYYLCHRDRIRAADRAEAAREATERLTAALLASSRRPDEAGLHPASGPTPSFDWRRADRETRRDMKERIRLAAARGEKIYPSNR